jgi:putative spermidine/putrescine transport system ATP-binding protein
MDEPLGALDKKLREQMQLEIRSLHRTLGITMLYVTHDQQEALTMSDRIVLLNGGRIEQTGTPDEIYFRPRSVFAADFLGDSSLIPASVETSGRQTSLVTDGGIRLLGEQTAIPPGTRVTAMLRPENVRLRTSSDQDGSDNSLAGRVIDTTVLGSVIRHHVRLHDGNTMVAHEFNRRDKSETRPGDTVTVTWHADDLLILSIPA